MTRTLLAFGVALALAATACGTRDANLAAEADPDSGAVAFAPGVAATNAPDGASNGGALGDGFGTTGAATTNAPRTSTVAGGSTGTTGTGTTPGATGTTTGGTTASPGTRPATGGGTTAPAGGSAAPAPPTTPGGGTTGGAAPSEGTTGGAAPAAAGGCTAAKDTFKVGYIRTDSGGVGAITGSDVAVSTEAQENEWQALFQWARDTGGLCGAEIEAIGENVAATSREEDRLALCVKFTEDYQVDFMLDTTLLTLPSSVVQCFHDHGVPIMGGVTSLDRDFIADEVAGTIAHPGASLDRLMIAAAIGPDQVGYYDEGTLGVILREDPIWQRAYDKYMAPAFESVGANIAAFSTIAPDGSTAPNVLLQMRTANVDHIVFIGGILEWLAFANGAESQGYRPRYAVGEYLELAGVTAFYGPQAQLHDAVASAASTSGVVYVPPGEEPQPVDLTSTSTNYRDTEMTEGEQRCLDILSQYTNSDYYAVGSNGNSTQEAFICDNAFTLFDGSRALSGVLDRDTWGEGIQSLAHEVSFRYKTSSFGDGIFDGDDGYRVGIFNDSAKYYVAVSDWQPLPR